jgi:peptidylprolyl isomerase
MAAYTIVPVAEVPDQAADVGMDPDHFEIRFLREKLGLENFAVTFERFGGGWRPARGHRHTVQEEVAERHIALSLEESGVANAAGRVRILALERPDIDKPEGDIPFELVTEDIVVGDGDEATKGAKVSVHYVGVAFSSGEEFDASWNRGQPFEFKLGKGQVIPGWDAGVEGMKVGGRRKLTIPSAMAYGARGAGGGVIAPHEPLVFVVDLLAVS